MAAHQRLLVAQQAQQGRNSLRATPISCRHAGVAYQTVSLDALDGAVRKAALKCFYVQRQQLQQRRCGSVIAGGPEHHFPIIAREAIKGANHLAHVTAVDPVAHQRPQVMRNPFLQLNRQIGDTAARVQHVGLREGIGGAGVQAAMTGTTAGHGTWFVLHQRQRGQQLAQEKEGAALRRNEHRVLPGEAQPRTLGVVPLQNGARIHIDLVLHLPTRLRLQPAPQLLHTRRHRVMIIDAPGVIRDTAPRRVVGHLLWQAHRLVIQRQANNGAHAGQDHLRVAAAHHAVWPRHVAHLALVAHLNPAQIGIQPPSRLRRHHPGHAKA